MTQNARERRLRTPQNRAAHYALIACSAAATLLVGVCLILAGQG